MSDAGVFNESTLEPALRQKTLGLPPPERLPNDNDISPYFIVGDDAFPLRTYLMKPYSHHYLEHDERVFNYRTSRGRRVVENPFGIPAMRFRCLLTHLQTTPENAILITKACVVLHQIM
ncbi:putative nuclease HARBI1 [Ylistrum balloti]|uniref:putative nuclease HARBI1 n=1 Tax=Ylistrum balloti TaxID=509963 RepID=UPI002905C460|nr:putative nuclease HARBI1 [Ylistrum balloti]